MGKFSDLKNGFIVILFVSFVLTACPVCADTQNDERNAVIKVVESFFSVLENRDPELAAEILVEGGVAFATRTAGQQNSMHRVGFKELLENLSKASGKMKEVMTNPKVMIHQNIAVLWAPYKFYLNGSYSHQGIDVFNLVKLEGKWQIAAILYTVEKK